MWYVVQSGDSLYTIARKFKVPLEQLVNTNRLGDSAIFIGQQLYIPVDTRQRTLYTVQPGDTLQQIARRFYTTVESIMVLNNLTSTAIYAGQRLVIPQYTEVVVTADAAVVRSTPSDTGTVLARMVKNARLSVIGDTAGWYRVVIYDESSGWIRADQVERRVHDGSKPITYILGFYTLEEGPALPSSFNSFVNNTDLLSELGLFMFRIDRNNPTQIEKFGEFSDNDVDVLVSIGHRNNVRILPIVHNLLYKPGDQTTSKDVVSSMLQTPQTRSAFIQNVINLIDRYGADGVLIDIEDVYREDSERLSAFYTELSAALRRRGYYFSASVPARVSDQPFNPFSDPFNYSVIGRAVDEFAVMLYNEHGWPGSGPGPVVSIGWMERVLRYTITKMPREKVLAAVSVFGFDFNLTTDGVSYVTFSDAMALAKQYNKEIIFDQPTQTPMFAYTDEKGDRHEVWFENRDSIAAKARLASDLGIKGLALWRLGLEDPNIWVGLQNDFVVRKV